MKLGNPKTNADVQMSEAFVTSVFLALSGGFQDAYTYFTREREVSCGKDVSGCCILIFNEMMQETQSASFRVNKDILNRQSVKARMLPMAMAG